MLAVDGASRHLDVLRELVVARVGGRTDRIAVVGNAPVSVSADRAARIDASDVVVRMTTFDVDHAIPAIGKRTDVVVLHRAMLAGPGTWNDYRRRLYFVAEPGRRHYEPERRTLWWPADAGALPIPNHPVSDSLNRLLGYSPEHAIWATTGTLAVWFMHLLFPFASVLLAGSSLLQTLPTRGRLAHAWGADVPLTPEHRPAREREVLQRWRSEGWLSVAAVDRDGDVE